jgi:hypothetical protein
VIGLLPQILIAALSVVTAFWLGQTAATRAERRKRARYIADWKSELFDIRDWADELRNNLVATNTSAFIRSPGEDTLRYMLMTNQVPLSIASRVAHLLDYVRLLNAVLAAHLAKTDSELRDSQAAEQSIRELAFVVGKEAQYILHDPDVAQRISSELARRRACK